MEEQYTYAVARIRAKELTLLNKQDMEQLLAAKDYDEAVRGLSDKGFGDGEVFENTEELLSYESRKTWNLIGELVKDMSVFDVFLYSNDYHNLKAAVKAVVTDVKPDKLFIKNGTVSPEIILKAVKERDYGILPEHMRETAQEAVSILLKTRDGQECDVLIDNAALRAIREAGRKSGNKMIDKYSELTVALTDIKIAVRSCKVKKALSFIKRAVAPCDTLDIESLAAAASKSPEDLYEYLMLTPYSDAVEEIKASMSAFEKWCDNRIMAHIKEQKQNPFTIGPLAAFILARENEIKAVRIILSGKQNSLKDSSVRERLRDLYV
ncbi:MAG: V-type ATPase subunit [Oscillospiraceae bacterium]|nr:V-type ATPase subunit [Oscillospiraceae bacterium]